VSAYNIGAIPETLANFQQAVLLAIVRLKEDVYRRPRREAAKRLKIQNRFILYANRGRGFRV
jgi:hypothetical protein